MPISDFHLDIFRVFLLNVLPDISWHFQINNSPAYFFLGRDGRAFSKGMIFSSTKESELLLWFSFFCFCSSNNFFFNFLFVTLRALSERQFASARIFLKELKEIEIFS